MLKLGWGCRSACSECSCTHSAGHASPALLLTSAACSSGMTTEAAAGTTWLATLGTGPLQRSAVVSLRSPAVCWVQRAANALLHTTCCMPPMQAGGHRPVGLWPLIMSHATACIHLCTAAVMRQAQLLGCTAQQNRTPTSAMALPAALQTATAGELSLLPGLQRVAAWAGGAQSCAVPQPGPHQQLPAVPTQTAASVSQCYKAQRQKRGIALATEHRGQSGAINAQDVSWRLLGNFADDVLSSTHVKVQWVGACVTC